MFNFFNSTKETTDTTDLYPVNWELSSLVEDLVAMDTDEFLANGFELDTFLNLVDGQYLVLSSRAWAFLEGLETVAELPGVPVQMSLF